MNRIISILGSLRWFPTATKRIDVGLSPKVDRGLIGKDVRTAWFVSNLHAVRARKKL